MQTTSGNFFLEHPAEVLTLAFENGTRYLKYHSKKSNLNNLNHNHFHLDSQIFEKKKHIDKMKLSLLVHIVRIEG